MFRFGIRSLLVVTAVAAALMAYHHYTKYYMRWRKIEELIAGFDSNRDQYSQFYRRIFSIAESDLLPWLQEHHNDSIALQSSWEAVERSVPVEQRNVPFNPGKKELNDFIQLLGDRFRAPMPDWWRELILSSRANRRYNIWFFDDNIKRPYHRIENVNCPSNAIIEFSSDGIIYSVDGDSILISSSVMERLSGFDDEFMPRNLSGCFTADCFFVTIHSNAASPHSISCIDRKSLDVIWQSEAFGCFTGFATGRHFSWVELVSSDSGQLFVFGFACTGLYLQSFDSGTGESSFHFSTGY